jgi:hypothetical protein
MHGGRERQVQVVLQVLVKVELKHQPLQTIKAEMVVLVLATHYLA